MTVWRILPWNSKSILHGPCVLCLMKLRFTLSNTPYRKILQSFRARKPLRQLRWINVMLSVVLFLHLASPTLYIITVYRVNLNKLSRNFVGAIRTTTTNCRVSFIDLHLIFLTNFRIVFLPHTNPVILLEPYCGTITEPGLPVWWQTFQGCWLFPFHIRFLLLIGLVVSVTYTFFCRSALIWRRRNKAGEYHWPLLCRLLQAVRLNVLIFVREK